MSKTVYYNFHSSEHTPAPEYNKFGYNYHPDKIIAKNIVTLYTPYITQNHGHQSYVPDLMRHIFLMIFNDKW